MNDCIQSRDVYCGGNNIIARLSAVDMIIRMDRLVPSLSPQELYRAIGYDFIGVHVSGGARTGLKNIHGKLRIQFAITDLLGRRLDDGSNRLGQKTEGGIGRGSMFLDETQRANELARQTQITDREVLDGSSGLRAVVSLPWHLHLPHRISFSSQFPFHGIIVARIVSTGEYCLKERNHYENNRKNYDRRSAIGGG